MRLLCVLLCALGTAVLGQDYIEGEYFIRLREDLVQSQAQEDAIIDLLKSDFNIDLQKFFRLGAVKALYVKGSADDVARAGQLKEVKHVIQNAYAYATQDCNAAPSPGTWGLDRADQRGPVAYTDPEDPSATYMWATRHDGNGVRAYVCDTGIQTDHFSFGGRAEWGYVGDGITNPTPGDNNGHGTHCAGTIGSNDFGVAKGVTLVAVKILNDSGSGPWSAIIDGLEWINTRDTARGERSVVSMSVGGGGQNTLVEDAINALVASGVTCVVSAGNGNTDACSQTPAFVPAALTIGATDINDASASFSNEGTCVDIFGPGVDILSTWPTDGTNTISGTSMSCPHVAGAVACFQSSQGTAPSPAEVDDYIKTAGTPDAISGITIVGTPNLMLFCDCVA